MPNIVRLIILDVDNPCPSTGVRTIMPDCTAFISNGQCSEQTAAVLSLMKMCSCQLLKRKSSQESLVFQCDWLCFFFFFVYRFIALSFVVLVYLHIIFTVVLLFLPDYIIDLHGTGVQ